jgi:hypothetical protein
MRATICPWSDCGDVSIRHALSDLGTMAMNRRAHDVVPVPTAEGSGGLDEEAKRQQPRVMLVCRAITGRVKRPKEEEQAAVVADIEGKEEYDSVTRLTRVNCRSDFIIWRSLFDACCRLCKLFNCQELKLIDSQSTLTLIDAQVVFEEMQQSATSVGVPQDAFNTFCTKTGSSKQMARAIFVDPEHGLYPQLFHPEQLISGKEDTTNNFSRGYYTIGKGMVLVANNFGDDLPARRSEIKQPWPPPQELSCLDLNIMVVSVFLATSDLHAMTYIYALSRKRPSSEVG